MPAQHIRLLSTAFAPDAFPQKSTLPEIAFAGRSNVGKSSTINSLSGISQAQKRFGARVSQTPGCTQSINFYNFDGRFLLVDLPGYGYAKISKKQRESIAGLIDAYFSEPRGLRLLVHLVDASLPPQKSDQTMLQWAKKIACPYLLVLNKCDKVSRFLLSKVKNQWESILKTEAVEGADILAVSAKKGIGIGDLRRRISDFSNGNAFRF